MWYYDPDDPGQTRPCILDTPTVDLGYATPPPPEPLFEPRRPLTWDELMEQEYTKFFAAQGLVYYPKTGAVRPPGWWHQDWALMLSSFVIWAAICALVGMILVLTGVWH